MSEEFLAFSDPLSITLLSFALMGLVTTTCVMFLMNHYRELPCIQTASYGCDVQLLVVIGCCFISSIVLFGRPDIIRCKLHHALPCNAVAMTIICVIRKISIVSKGKLWINNILSHSNEKVHDHLLQLSLFLDEHMRI